MGRIQLVIRILELYDKNEPVKSICTILKKGGTRVSRSFVYRVVKPFKPRGIIDGKHVENNDLR